MTSEYQYRSLWQEIKMDVISKKHACGLKQLLPCLIVDIEFQTMLSYRIRHRIIKLGILGKAIERVLHILTIWYTACHIDARAKIEGGVRIIHADGVVIGEGAVIKHDVIILHQVTIGVTDIMLDYEILKNDFATVEPNAILCAGAKLLGKIRIGENAVVGANAVVSRDVPDNMIAVGIPAVNKMKKPKV